MKSITSLIVSLVLTTCFLTGVVPESEMSKNNVDHYQYPITLTSDEWFDYSVIEKSEMLRIDENILHEMTDEQLVYAIADYPYLVDFYAYDENVKLFSEYCDALKELLSRRTKTEALKKYGDQIIREVRQKSHLNERDQLVVFSLQDILRAVLMQIDGNNASLSYSYVLTPEGTPVYVTHPDEPEDHIVEGYHAGLDASMVNAYGVTVIRSGSCRYNCHSYAWHSTSSSNNCWMPGPSPYMTDGSYAQKYSGSVSSVITSYGVSQNDKVCYSGNSHSAILTGYTGQGVPLATISVTSKWGAAGVFVHTISNVPPAYNYSTVSIWHLNSN